VIPGRAANAACIFVASKNGTASPVAASTFCIRGTSRRLASFVNKKCCPSLSQRMFGIVPLKLTRLTGSKMSSIVSSLFCAFKEGEMSARTKLKSNQVLSRVIILNCFRSHPLDEWSQHCKNHGSQQSDTREDTEASRQHRRVVSGE